MIKKIVLSTFLLPLQPLVENPFPIQSHYRASYRRSSIKSSGYKIIKKRERDERIIFNWPRKRDGVQGIDSFNGLIKDGRRLMRKGLTRPCVTRVGLRVKINKM